jgi:trehalose 6-phosphate synthase
LADSEVEAHKIGDEVEPAFDPGPGHEQPARETPGGPGSRNPRDVYSPPLVIVCKLPEAALQFLHLHRARPLLRAEDPGGVFEVDPDVASDNDLGVVDPSCLVDCFECTEAAVCHCGPTNPDDDPGGSGRDGGGDELSRSARGRSYRVVALGSAGDDQAGRKGGLHDRQVPDQAPVGLHRRSAGPRHRRSSQLPAQDGEHVEKAIATVGQWAPVGVPPVLGGGGGHRPRDLRGRGGPFEGVGGHQQAAGSRGPGTGSCGHQGTIFARGRSKTGAWVGGRVSVALGMVVGVGLADLVVVSNRGPLTFRLGDEGKPEYSGPAGGLAGTLREVFEGKKATWVSCAMGEADRAAASSGLMADPELDLVMVDPDPETYKMAYQVVANATLWFAHHHLFDAPRRPKMDFRFRQAWDGYREVNGLFADAIDLSAEQGAAVLVQDYHLTLVPGILAERRPDLKLVHFTHTPFADPDILRMLPTDVASEMLAAMAGARACGFHTGRWEAGFLECCSSFGIAPPRTFYSGLSPDADRLRARAAKDQVSKAGNRLQGLVGDRACVVKVDRVEPSKNLLRAIWAFEELLETRPKWRNRAVLMLLAYSSRQELPEYLAYSTEVELAARMLNERWAQGDWTPVILEIADDPSRSMAALGLYDVLLINPVRDGMNLVAKEGPILNEKSGVLALSTEAGAHEELAGPAVSLNPFDVTETAGAIAAGLEMPADERRARATELRSRSTARTPEDWLSDQLKAAAGGR